MNRAVAILPWMFLGIFSYMYVRDFAHNMTANDNWFTVEQILVMDTVEGESPRLVVKRHINKPFVAEWIVTTRRLETDGLTTVCVGDGKSHYISEARLPADLNLDWWAGKACSLAPGRYQLDTKWIIEIPGYTGQRLVEARSNIFTVTERHP
jgi:hypothetical protein